MWCFLKKPKLLAFSNSELRHGCADKVKKCVRYESNFYIFFFSCYVFADKFHTNDTQLLHIAPVWNVSATKKKQKILKKMFFEWIGTKI